MSAELQDLLEKIQRDGVDKANAESAKIIDEAKVKAAAIVKEANEAAAAAKKQSEADAKAYAARAEETIKQAARDTVLKVRDEVDALLTAILVKNVDAALSDPAVVASIAADAVKSIAAGNAEVAVSGKLVDAIRAQLAKDAAAGITVISDETLGTGFSVRIDGGRVEHAFTGDVIAAEIAKRLRPALAALVK